MLLRFLRLGWGVGGAYSSRSSVKWGGVFLFSNVCCTKIKMNVLLETQAKRSINGLSPQTGAEFLIAASRRSASSNPQTSCRLHHLISPLLPGGSVSLCVDEQGACWEMQYIKTNGTVTGNVTRLLWRTTETNRRKRFRVDDEKKEEETFFHFVRAISVGFKRKRSHEM